MPEQRLPAGFTTLEGGVNGGIAPSLIPKNQCVSALNVTFRQGYAQSRDPWFNYLINVPSTLVNRYTGTFQGAGRYDGQAGQSGFIVARGGRLFFIADNTWLLSEITPVITVTTTNRYTVPTTGSTVDIPVTTETPFTVGQNVLIGGELYTIANLSSDLVTATYNAASYTNVIANFTVPATNTTVTIQVTDSSWAKVGQTVFIATAGYYQVTAVPDNSHITVLNLGDPANAAALTVIVQPQRVALVVLVGTSITDLQGNAISAFDELPPTFDFVFIFQAENYGIILRGQHKTVIYDGSHSQLATETQIPPGYVGAYGWGRIWLALPDNRSFVAGNLVFDRSGGGTAQNNFRDSILFFTDNDFLNEGGAFGVPYNAGDITGMQFLAAQDTSLGVGVLLVGTTNMVFSVNAPVDRTTWKNLTYPIQTISLIDYGPEAPRGVVSINGDMWYRSPDGFRSFLVVRRYFGQPGNVPESREISPILDLDTPDLLFYGSGVYFDNKLFYTVSPFRTVNGDVAHRGLAVINYDLVSSLRNRSQAAWEGISTGLNIFQILKGRINNVERMFMFALGKDNQTLELWENTIENFIDDTVIAPTVITRKPIASQIITRSEDFGTPGTIKLIFGELFVDDVAEQVDITISFRPDQYPAWTVWQRFSICANTQQCNFLGELPCAIFVPAQRLYASDITLGEPPNVCNTLSTPNQPMFLGHEMQFKLEWTGHMRVRKFRPLAKIWDEAVEGACPAQLVCNTFRVCDEPIFTYDSHP